MNHRSVALVVFGSLACLACVGPRGSTPAQAEREPPGSFRGEVASQVVRDFEGNRQVVHRLRQADGRLRPLLLPAGVELDPGSAVRVFGTAEGEAIRVQRHEVLGEAGVEGVGVEPVARALVSGMKKPARRWAFVLVDIDAGGNPIDKVNAKDVLFNPKRPDSIRSYFNEVSYGLQDLDGEVFGPLPYAMGGRCDTDRLAKELIPQIPGKFDQYLWFFGKQQAACNWAGIADLGNAERPTRNSWYNSFHSCAILVQEPGHNFGMVHSSAMHCTVAGQPVPIAWPGQTEQRCLHEEYGNPFDPMGGGDCYHMNGVQKAYQDWMAGCNVVKATESGTFTIHPLESACDGPQLLHVPFPAPRPFGKAGTLSGYYLELRAPVGYRDRELDAQVLVIVGNDVREARLTGNNNWLLDMTPETETLDDAALPVGKRFEDTLPGGPKFTVLSVDATKAVIKVELAKSTVDPNTAGKGVCPDMTPFEAPGPSNCVAPPTPAAPVKDGGMGVTDAGVVAETGGAGGSTGGGQSPADGAGGSAGAMGAGSSSGSGGSSGAGRGGSAAAPTAPASSGAQAKGGCTVAPGAGSPGAGLGLGGLLALAALVRAFRRRAG